MKVNLIFILNNSKVLYVFVAISWNKVPILLTWLLFLILELLATMPLCNVIVNQPEAGHARMPGTGENAGWKRHATCSHRFLNQIRRISYIGHENMRIGSEDLIFYDTFSWSKEKWWKWNGEFIQLEIWLQWKQFLFSDFATKFGREKLWVNKCSCKMFSG